MLDPGDGYRVLREQGADVLAHDLLLDRAVVLRGLGDDEIAWARALARLDHPSLQRVYRVGRSGARAYLVCEHVRGARLNAVAVGVERGRAVARAIAGAVVALHGAGVAHGAISAAEVVVSDDEEARLSLPGAPGGSVAEDVRALVELTRRLTGEAPEADSAADVLGLLADDRGPLRPGERPYRGLASFRAEDAGVFFGRRVEVQRVIERLQVEPWVIVAAPSGAGKSSLCRAGIVPAVATGALGAPLAAAVHRPGRRPLAALAAALGRPDAGDELAREPDLAAAWARDRSLLLVVDQLEEIFTLAGEEDRRAYLGALGSFGVLRPRTRLLATLRADFLGRLAGAPVVGADLVRATYALAAMSDEALREAVVGPARQFGHRFESDETVDELVAVARGGAGGLPLVAFVLAEIWERRDRERRILPAAALRDLGGARGALGRHAERVYAALPPADRPAARRALLALVGPEGTRRPRAAGELPPGSERVLAALVRGRLVAASEVVELAHEAILEGWPRLRGWLDEEIAGRAAVARARLAAAEWRRLGRPADGLLGPRQLAELDAPEARAELASEPLAEELVAASRAARRRRRAAAAAALAAAVVLAAGAVAVGSITVERRAAARQALVVAAARRGGQAATAADLVRSTLEEQAFAHYRRDEPAAAEPLWRAALATASAVDGARARALAVVEPLAATDAGARALAADLLALRVAASRSDPALARALRARLALHDDGSRAAALDRPAQLFVEGPARVTIEPGRRVLPPGWSPVAPGSYVVLVELPGGGSYRLPLAVRPGEKQRVRAAAPPPAPEGFVWIPPGRFRYGARESEDTRTVLDAYPEHDEETGGFFIARRETTGCEYHAFAKAKGIAPVGPASCDLPASGVSQDDALAYVAWLSSRVPGARLCREREWERAARGPDGRRFPHGDELRQGEACTREAGGGPCAPGAHPATRSVYGVDDLVGGVWEWTGDRLGELAAARGGSWAEPALSPFLFSSNRGLVPWGQRSAVYGIRVCADAPGW